METNKISAIATVIAIVSCKMNQEGLCDLMSDGQEYYIKPEFIIDIWNKYHLSKQFGVLTKDEIHEVCYGTFLHGIRASKNEKNAEKILEGILCSKDFLNHFFNTTNIEPLQHLMITKPLCTDVNLPSSTQYNSK